MSRSYLNSPDDTAKLLRGVKLLLKIAQTQPLSDFLDGSSRHKDLDHQQHLKSDEELMELIKERVETVYHPAGTCRMAPVSEQGVVDSKLRVYGIRGLRVCDASIFPWIVSGHTVRNSILFPLFSPDNPFQTGACYAVAEKLADDIKAEFRSS
jgi:choline dehydrogenase